MTQCLLKEHGQCCCQCRYRLEARTHPMGSKYAHACIAFAFEEGEPTAYIGDFEHGICEMFRPLPWPLSEETKKGIIVHPNLLRYLTPSGNKCSHQGL